MKIVKILIIQICQNLVPLDRYSSNAKIKDGGETTIYWAAWKGNTEVVIILAPRTYNPNASDKDRYIPNN